MRPVFNEISFLRHASRNKEQSISAVTLPHFKEVIIYDHLKAFRRRIKPLRQKIKSNPGRAPILRHASRNKEQSIAN